MKRFLRRAGAALLASILLLSLSACGAGNGTSTGGTPATSASASTTNDEIVKLRIWGFAYNSTSEDLDAVAEAVNAITREKIGVEVEIVRDSDAEKLNLAMNSGEQWDLVNYHKFTGGLPALVNNGMAMPLDDLAAQYGQDALAAVGEEMLNAGKINGVLYSIPSIDVWANGYGLMISQKVMEELDIDPDTLKTWDDVHEALLKMKEAHPDIYPVVASWAGGGMQKTFAWDNLGTGFWDALGVLENCQDSSTKVVNMYETESYRELCERMYQWRQDGLLAPDATTTTENGSSLIDVTGFAIFENITPTKREELASGQYWGDGKKGVAIELVEPFISSDAGGSSYFIPTVCEHPEKAMQLWNLMYTDKELADILTYGVEGRDFEYTDDSHEVVRRFEDSTYSYTAWTWPNQSITATLEEVSPDIWEQNNAFKESAAVSPAIGFKFDSSAVMNEITACNNVIAKYEVGLRWGELDPEETLPKFNKELYEAGLQTIIDEKQKQLDAFLAQ